MLPNRLSGWYRTFYTVLPNIYSKYYRTYTRNITEHTLEILPNIYLKYYRTYTRNNTEHVLEILPNVYSNIIDIKYRFSHNYYTYSPHPLPLVVRTLCPSRLKLRNMVTLSRNRTMGYRTAMGMLPNSNVHVTEHK